MENRTVGKGAILTLATALVLALASTSALAKPPEGKGKPPKDDGGGKGTAMVTISGPMVTPKAHSFGLDRDTDQTLILNSWTGDVRGAPVEISYDFTDDTIGSCLCKDLQGKKQTWDTGGETVSCRGLEGHLNDFAPLSEGDLFPLRWHVAIEVENPGVTSTTNHKGGHSIAITTDPSTLTATISGTTEVLWIPEGPSRSGLVTVTWIQDEEQGGKRVRIFQFTPPFKIQVVTDPDENKVQQIMRCESFDDLPITVTVETPTPL